MRNFYLKKKWCEGVYGFPRIFLWSCRKNDGGGVEVLVERLRVESVLQKNEKKEKERKEKWGSEPAKGMKRWVKKEWWVVGLGGARRNHKKYDLTLFLFFLNRRDITNLAPNALVSSSKDPIDPSSKASNQRITIDPRLGGNTLHMRASLLECTTIFWLKWLACSTRSVLPL